MGINACTFSLSTDSNNVIITYNKCKKNPVLKIDDGNICKHKSTVTCPRTKLRKLSK